MTTSPRRVINLCWKALCTLFSSSPTDWTEMALVAVMLKAPPNFMTPWRLVVENSRRPTLWSTTIWSLYGQGIYYYFSELICMNVNPWMDFSCKILRRRRSNNHNSNSFFNCNSFQTHQVGTPTFSLPNLVGHFFLLFTQSSFLDENERKMPTYVRFFYQKGANFHLFVLGVHDRIRAKPKFEFYRPVLTLMDSL